MMKLEKLTIHIYEKVNDAPIEVLFNPSQLTIKRTGWTKDKDSQLVPADASATLSVELFFDTSLPPAVPSSMARMATTALLGRAALVPSIGRTKDVRKYTKPIFDLTKSRGTFGKVARPPRCLLRWGLFNETLFRGVLVQVSQTFTQFLEDGTPVRATLSCEFEEWENAEFKKKAQNPVDDPIRIVKRGETLSSIAAEEYGDPTLWRVIANANPTLIQNPRKLAPGTALTVPPLRPNNSTPGR